MVKKWNPAWRPYLYVRYEQVEDEPHQWKAEVEAQDIIVMDVAAVDAETVLRLGRERGCWTKRAIADCIVDVTERMERHERRKQRLSSTS